MKSIAELRKKYWSGNITKLVPTTVSPSSLKVRFDFKELDIDHCELEQAQLYAKKAMSLHRGMKATRGYLLNKANYHLAGAYQIAGKNEEFWSQF